MSPFAAAGDRLRDNGLSVIPIMPGAKAPGTMTQGQWRLEHGWSRFCDRKPTDLEMNVWEKWPDAGIGVALGASSGVKGMILVAADVDTDDAALVAAMNGVLPPSPVRKRGRKGECRFYLARPAVINRSFNVGGERVLDLLAHGRQTVLPPTIHPSGGAYHWITPDTLETYDLADLPVLPDDIGDQIAAALAPFGYQPPVVHAKGEASLEGESIHRALNDAALQNLDAWVPALNLYNCTRSGGGYRATAHWRPSASGRHISKRAANLSIDPHGIKDFGDADKGYTPLDLVMAACGCDLDLAFRWLQEHVAPQKPVTLALKSMAEPEVPAAPKRTNLAGLVDPNAAVVAEVSILHEPAPLGPVVPDAACFPPGVLGEITEWIVASADTPSPQLALAAAIPTLGAFIGRRFEGPTRARTNFYTVGVAPTGFGKNHSPTCCSTLAYEAGLQKYLGPEDIKSDSAFRKLLEIKPSVAVLMDEFDGWIGKILDRKAAAHDRRMRDMMLTLFSRANGVYHGSEGATEKAVPIMNPNLCIGGATTPGKLWNTFSSASAEDGLLPRFLIFDVGDARPEIVRPKADPSQPPAALLARLRAIMDVRPKGNLNGVGGMPNKPIRAEWGVGAEEWFMDFRTSKREEAMSSGGMREIVASREAEHVVKLALLYAVGCEAENPVITTAALEWARTVVTCSATALLGALESRVADSDKQAEYLWVLRQVREAGQWGIPERDLIRAIRGKFDKRRYDDIMGQLLAAEEVYRDVRSGEKGGRPTQRVFAKVAVDEAA
jgi:hypothetical protein